MKLDDRKDGITDQLLASAMEELRDEAKVAVDWDRLRSSINDRAALPLARRRTRRQSIVTRRFVPVALAASVAFALWIGPGAFQQVFGPAGGTGAVGTIDSDEILVQALGSDLSEHEFRLLVTGRTNPEVLLAVAVGTR